MQNKLTNFLLAAIVACLIFQIVQSFNQKPFVIAASQPKETSSGLSTNILDVRVVEMLSPLKVNVAQIGGDSLDEVDGRAVLPIGIRNTISVDVKSFNGKTMRSSFLSEGKGAEGFPVIILNK